MKNSKNIFLMAFAVLAMFVSACDPNKELYEKLDNDQHPYNEKGLAYSLVDDDYTRFGGFISQNKAFSDTIPAKEYIPDILKVRFVTLRDSSSVVVSYNQFLLQPDWWDAGFGYLMSEQEISNIVGPGITSFSDLTPASEYLHHFLSKTIIEPQANDTINLMYRFSDDGEISIDHSTYFFDGSEWIALETITKIPYVGYEMVAEDYLHWGGYIAQNNRFSEDFPAEEYLPAFLRNRFAYAKKNEEKVVKYKYQRGNASVEKIDKYHFDGITWNFIPYTITKSEQYIFGANGWAFDPTVRFQINREEYLYLAQIDPLPHPVYNDFGYYYGASAFYSNFDVRLMGRRLNKLSDDTYSDPALGAIFDAQGTEAAMKEMLRRIQEEGIIKLLQFKYPDATPQVDGIDVHYFVSYQTFADNWIRNYPRSQYICTAAGTPPQFELVTQPK